MEEIAMQDEGPRIIEFRSHWNQRRRAALAERRRREIYRLTRSFELAYLDALCERLRRRLAHLRRRHA